MKRFATLLLVWVGITLRLLGAEGDHTPAEPFAFIQLSDPQFGMFSADADFAQETANFEFAIATINRLRPAFVIITGDLVNKAGDAAQIAEFRRIAAKIDPSIVLYNVAGNHDVGNVPTPASLAAYTNVFGPDHYSFRQKGLVGIVLNSSLIHSPDKAPEQFAGQDQWFRAELARLRGEGARQIVVFQHHPWFLISPDEPDQYFNIPKERRAKYLALFQEFGVKYLFSGHYHRNAFARTDNFESITTAPVGMPIGPDKSGLRIAIVRGDRIEQRYYDFGEQPNRIALREETKK